MLSFLDQKVIANISLISISIYHCISHKNCRGTSNKIASVYNADTQYICTIPTSTMDKRGRKVKKNPEICPFLLVFFLPLETVDVDSHPHSDAIHREKMLLVGNTIILSSSSPLVTATRHTQVLCCVHSFSLFYFVPFLSTHYLHSSHLQHPHNIISSSHIIYTPIPTKLSRQPKERAATANPLSWRGHLTDPIQ